MHFDRYPWIFANSSQSMIGEPESLLDFMCVARIVSLSSCQEQGVWRWGGCGTSRLTRGQEKRKISDDNYYHNVHSIISSNKNKNVPLSSYVPSTGAIGMIFIHHLWQFIFSLILTDEGLETRGGEGRAVGRLVSNLGIPALQFRERPFGWHLPVLAKALEINLCFPEKNFSSVLEGRWAEQVVLRRRCWGVFCFFSLQG